MIKTISRSLIILIMLSFQYALGAENPTVYPVRLVNFEYIKNLNEIDTALHKPVDMSKSGGELELSQAYDMKSDQETFKESSA